MTVVLTDENQHISAIHLRPARYADTTTNSYDYTGRESDGLGLHFYRARYYNPSQGRFISEDPMGTAAGPNAYQYVSGSPTNGVDPSGKLGPEGCLIGMAGYAFGQALNGLAGRKMATGWNAVGGLAGNCLLGVATEGFTVWAQDFLEMGEAAEALEEAEAAEGASGICCFAAGTPVHTAELKPSSMWYQ